MTTFQHLLDRRPCTRLPERPGDGSRADRPAKARRQRGTRTQPKAADAGSCRHNSSVARTTLNYWMPASFMGFEADSDSPCQTRRAALLFLDGLGVEPIVGKTADLLPGT